MLQFYDQDNNRQPLAQDFAPRSERISKSWSRLHARASGAEPVSTAAPAESADRLPWAAAVALPLLPGTLTMAALLAVTPPLVQSGWPRLLCYQVAVGTVGIPAMLGVMSRYARRTTGRPGLGAAGSSLQHPRPVRCQGAAWSAPARRNPRRPRTN
jgi:hypothetical protein